jgi:PAS domain S-box-containing protein
VALRHQLKGVLTRGSGRFETVLRRSDGQPVDVEMSGAVVHVPFEPGQEIYARLTINISCRDVSERRRSEAALRQSERERHSAEDNLREERDFIASVLDTADVLIVVLDADGRIVRWSGQCVRMSGYSEDEVRGRSFAELAGGECPLKAQTKTLPWRTRSDEQRWIVWRSSTVPGGDGEPHFIIGAGVDVTEQRLLEEQLRHAQRMEMLGTLVGGIAHDFNNHLTAIIGNLQLVLGGPDMRRRRDDLGSEFAELLGDAEQAAQRCAEMTQRLLTFSHARGALNGHGPCSPLPETPLVVLEINGLVREAVRLLHHVLPATISVVTDLERELWPIRGDGTGLHQVLMNLALNSRDAMPSGGELHIATVNSFLTPEDSSQHISVQSGPHVEITVRDTGAGMSPEVMKRIFDPFFTTKKAGLGTGLGLAVVYGIVKSHGGSIHAVSAPGQGTTFRILLPAQPGAKLSVREDKAEPVVAEWPANGSAQRTVLVVDDEELVRNLARSVLERGGYRVVLAEDGEQALEAFRRLGHEVSAVLLDYTMPHMTGVQVFEAMRQIDPQVRVIFSTGYAGDHDCESLMASGACGFVPKPYRPQDLLNIVRSTVEV